MPDGYRLGLELAPSVTRTGFLKGFRLRLTVQALVEGPESVAAVQPVGLLPLVEAVHDALRGLAGDFRRSSWAVQAWGAIGAMDGDQRWMHTCVPWTTSVRPQARASAEYFDQEGAAVHTVRFWEATARAGATAWPDDWPAVRTVAGVPQPPQVRPASYSTSGLVDLAPPAPDTLVTAAGVLAP